MKTELLRVEFLCKFFHQDMILDHVTFNVFEGETLAILGANGAGKTPLVRILGGILQKDTGELFFREEPLFDYSLEKAQALGIHIVQHCGRIADSLTVAENICIPARPRGWINHRKIAARAKALMGLVGLARSPYALTGDLCASEKSLVELAAVLNLGPRLLIFDEPPLPYSGSLGQKILNVIAHLKAKGSSVIYVTDNIRDALQVADRILVLRDGIAAGIFDRQSPYFNPRDLLTVMAGKGGGTQAYEPARRDDVIMEVRDLSCRVLHDINFHIYRGEILGIVGPMDSNKSVLLQLLYGFVRRTRGTILIDGEAVHIRSPKDAVRLGISYFTSMKEKSHLLPGLTVMENITLAAARRVSSLGWIKPHIEKHYAASLLEAFSIPPSLLSVVTGRLSSGLRQKIQFIQCLAAKPRIMLLYEPTNGIDLETKKEIREGIKRMAAEGCTFVVVSSNMQESLGICDRFLVLSGGAIKGELSKPEAEQSKIIELMQK
ncbi:sugar ABC transporter ATP-binding protein [Christensenella minuta]|uniref:sugar ABC transporter ATP-binding protein n=1 Tax=Christensenella minuta TaxID=626937 RepID=UPI002A80556D|nr:sugar ABC transporter ATP-binding protein [Christensenella minuta]MDY3751452.1 sugar ABC transporter ATP-binding protein [Christensenella minuta]